MRKMKDPARFENSQKGSSLGKKGKINKELKKKMKDPARLENSQKWAA